MQSRGFHQRCAESHVGPLESSRFESAILGSGHTFSTANEFWDAIYLMNCLKHMTVICVVEGCPWKVTACAVGRTKIVQVHIFRNEHNHSLKDMSISEPTVPYYLPRQICKDFRRQYGMELNYCQAWNLKEKAKERIHGVPQCSYKLLPWLCTRLIETNPGTIAEYRCSDDGHFMQLFVALSVSIHGVLYFQLLPMMLTMACFHLLMGYLARELRGLALVLEKLKMVIGERDVIIISIGTKGLSVVFELYGEWGLMYLIMLMIGISTIYGTVRDALGHTYPFLNPPTTKRPPGRPRKRRIESQFMSKKTVHCSRCNQPGHNRATCNNPLL
ncbi:hypothetical protein AAG906_026083 [Vitis piasezkii]